MKKIISLILIGLTITSCSGSKKIKPLIEFTTKLVPNSTKSVKVDNFSVVTSFGNQLEFFSRNSASVKINEINNNTKFNKVKLSSSKLAAMPYVKDSNIYYIDDRAVVGCKNFRDNTQKWEIELNPYKTKLAFATLSLYRDKLYITADSSLHVLDINSGKEIYKETLADSVKVYPTIQENALIIQDVSNRLFAINTDNFKKVWSYETWPEYIISNVPQKPIYHERLLITAFSSGQLVALDIYDGRELWQKNMLEGSSNMIEYSPVSFSTMPIVNDNNLYVASSNNTISKIDLNSSDVKWNKKFEDVISMSNAGNTLFITNNARQIAAISKEDGSVMWTSDLLSPSTSDSSRIYPSNFMPPLISDDKVFVVSSKGDAFNFDKLSGTLVDYIKLPNNIRYLAVDNNDLLLIDNYSVFLAK